MIIDKTKKYLLFFDIDGTLIYQPKITDRVINSIKSAQEHGHKVFVNTGRPLGAVFENIISPIKWDGIIAACGATILLDDKIVYTKRISNNLIVSIAKDCLENNSKIIFEGEELNILFNSIESELSYNFLNVSDVDDLKLQLEKYHFNKMTFYDTEPTWFKIYHKYFNVIKHTHYVETAFKGYSKAKGIELLHDYIDFDNKYTIAFGDSYNDKEMLNFVNVGVVMGQGKEDLKQNASYVTDSVFDDGIATFIEKYLL